MLKLFAAAALSLCLAIAPVLAAEVSLDADEQGQIAFVTPSGNIGCLYTPEGGTDIYEPVGGGPELICDRVEPSYVRMIFGPSGKPHRINNPGEQSCCSADQVLEYGDSADLDGFYCEAATTGLSCESSDGDHGFMLSKAKIQVW